MQQAVRRRAGSPAHGLNGLRQIGFSQAAGTKQELTTPPAYWPKVAGVRIDSASKGVPCQPLPPPAAPADTSSPPSGLNATLWTPAPCPLRVRASCPVRV